MYTLYYFFISIFCKIEFSVYNSFPLRKLTNNNNNNNTDDDDDDDDDKSQVLIIIQMIVFA
jgi:hypothetical protein